MLLSIFPLTLSILLNAFWYSVFRGVHWRYLRSFGELILWSFCNASLYPRQRKHKVSYMITPLDREPFSDQNIGRKYTSRTEQSHWTNGGEIRMPGCWIDWNLLETMQPYRVSVRKSAFKSPMHLPSAVLHTCSQWLCEAEGWVEVGRSSGSEVVSFWLHSSLWKIVECSPIELEPSPRIKDKL